MNILFIMPYGKKDSINFDEIYNQFKSKLSKLDMDAHVHRVDAMRSSNINEKMYKAIIAADIVVADLTLLNANVLYELGVRHSFAKKTTKLIAQNTDKIPFDISAYSVTKYSIDDSKIINLDKVCRIIMNKEKFSDSAVYNSLIDLKPTKISDDYFTVFENLDNKYEEFKAEIERFERRNDFLGGLNYMKKIKFGPLFEPYVTKLSLFTYKASNEDLLGLINASKIINNLTTIQNASSEVMGLNVTIKNKLFKLGTGSPKEIDRINNLFFHSKKTVWSFGTYLASRIYLSNPEYFEKETYLSVSEVIADIKRVSREFDEINIDDINERDLPYYLDTKNLLKLVFSDIQYDVIVENSSKKLLHEIINWKKLK